MTGDGCFDARQSRRGEDFLVGRFGFAQRDVVAQLSEEQIDILPARTRTPGAQIGRIELAARRSRRRRLAFLRT